MESGCIFCKIIAGEIPAEKVYEDDEILAFRDIQPAAPTHVLLIPKAHIPTVDDLEAGQDELIGRILRTAAVVARQEGLEAGYRLVTNCGRGAGQEVFHLHVHLLGGRPFGWPPG
ncbi:MAG: histidine triad nucleotide-binding protein [Candidatus Eisenbacteria sp.]|nr:histidine triad nucleotide-binding protein [Candidatus Eisenbacteria bacterium]